MDTFWLDYVTSTFFVPDVLKFYTYLRNVTFNCDIDVAPNYSSPLNALGNTIGSIAGICGPVLVGILTTAFPDKNGIWGWRLTFLLTATMSCGCLPLWYWFLSASVVAELNSPDLRRLKRR